MKSDFNRVLLTDVQPYELPVIISNEGFYRNILEFGELKKNNTEEDVIKIVNQLFFDWSSSKYPFEYEIVKTDTSTRQLALIHPSSQTAVVDFYKKYSTLIVEQCQRSNVSLRYPSGYASTYYIPQDKINKENNKQVKVETKENTFYQEYPSSYFTYAKFPFLKKFHQSRMLINLESKYSKMRKLDIANCFGNIYTHSISWALKPKSLVKKIILSGKPKGGFDSEFDNLMQKSNQNETNGILVGAEVSRIFAELILQKVDSDLKENIKSAGLELGKDIQFYRYMDDYFLFFNKDNDANLFELNLSRKLREFKLTLNDSKKSELEKPFVTANTRAEIEIGDFMTTYFDELLTSCRKDKLRRRKGEFQYLMTRLRSLIISTHVPYQDASKMALADIKRFVQTLTKIPDFTDFNEKRLSSFMKLIIEASFYLYSNDRRYNSSSIVSQIVLTLINLEKNKLDEEFEEQNQFQSFISSKIIQFISSDVLQLLNVETCNFLCLLNELNSTFEIPINELKSVIASKDLNYFTVVCLLSLFRDESSYQGLKTELCKKVCNYLLSKSGGRSPKSNSKFHESELVHLFCDFMSCPYVAASFKKRAYEEFITPIGSYDSVKIINYFCSRQWFVSWNDLTMETNLKKKRLKLVY
jgi:hypothetical protein